MRALFTLALLSACAPEPSDDGTEPPSCVLLEAPAPCDDEVERTDSDGDGDDDLVVHTVREDGLVVRFEVDTDGDGAWDSATLVTWDDQGRELTETFDPFADGVDLIVDTHTWYDEADGYAEWLDRGTDGVTDTITTTHLDAAGRRVEVLVDLDADGVDDQVERWEYDAAGNRSARRFDDGIDGTYEVVERWTWDDAGRIVRSSFDLGDNGEESWTTSTWDDCGHELTHIEVNVGQLTRRTDRTFDEAGHLIDELYDEYADGIAESVTTWTWDGGVERGEVDLGVDGTIDRRFEQTWDADGRLIGARADHEADGTWDEVWALEATCAI